MAKHSQFMGSLSSLLAFAEDPQGQLDEHQPSDASACMGGARNVEAMVESRAIFFAKLRNAKSWTELHNLLAGRGFDLIESKGVFFAVNRGSGAMFELSDCGHNATVFLERLGAYHH